MSVFTDEDVKRLVDDLCLYSGNISDVTDLHGPHPHNGWQFGGVIHTSMDTFNFLATPLFCDDESWSIDLADPTQSLRQGDRSIVRFSFPKLHKDPQLQSRYRVANILYHAYNGYSNVTEASRLPHYEQMLGYENLSSFGAVLEAIIRDFRSFQEDKRDKEHAQYAKN
jgi:hypothetical protein